MSNNKGLLSKLVSVFTNSKANELAEAEARLQRITNERLAAQALANKQAKKAKAEADAGFDLTLVGEDERANFAKGSILLALRDEKTAEAALLAERTAMRRRIVARSAEARKALEAAEEAAYNALVNDKVSALEIELEDEEADVILKRFTEADSTEARKALEDKALEEAKAKMRARFAPPVTPAAEEVKPPKKQRKAANGGGGEGNPPTPPTCSAPAPTEAKALEALVAYLTQYNLDTKDAPKYVKFSSLENFSFKGLNLKTLRAAKSCFVYSYEWNKAFWAAIDIEAESARRTASQNQQELGPNDGVSTARAGSLNPDDVWATATSTTLGGAKELEKDPSRTI